MSVLCNNLNGFNSGPAGASGTADGLASISGSPNIRSGTYSLACRVKFSAVPTTPEVMAIALTDNASFGGAYIGRFSGDPANRWSMIRYNGAATAQSVNVSGAYATGAWRHFAMTYDGTNIRGYTDGALSGTTASVTTTCPNTAACSFTMAGYGQFTIQDAVVFSGRVLTLEEIQLLNVQRGAPELLNRGDLIGWYPEYFDDRLRDWSGRGNNATSNFIGGAGTVPAANNEDAGVGWIRTRGRIWVPLGTIVTADGDGRTLYNASGVHTSAVAESGTGATKYNASGAQTAAVAASATGATLYNASGVQTSAVAKAGDGRTLYNASGTQTAAVAAVADGRTKFDGAATSTSAVASSAAGQTLYNASGTATAILDIPATGDGRTTYNGQGTATVSVAATADGRTVYNAFGTQTAAVAAAGDGRTLYDALGVLGASGTGQTTYNGIGTATIAIATTGDGRTLYNGSATPESGGGGAGYRLQTASVAGNRRHTSAYGARRKIR